MNKDFWIKLLAEWEATRERRRQFCPGWKDGGLFICLIADGIHPYGDGYVHEALQRDGLNTNGAGFCTIHYEYYDPDDIDYQNVWNRVELSGPEYNDNDRRLLWLKEQVARYD